MRAPPDGPVVEEWDSLRLVSDADDDGRPDVVQGVTAAARQLAGLIVRRPVRRALDLGTGCGVLALTLARHAEQVVGTDVNPRAIALARRSAQLSGMEIEWRVGDWYEPVRGERFDLIACNPPYVISPDTRLVYRDGSDATEGVVRGAGAHLTDGGLAHFLVNWAHDPGDWAAPLRTWIPPGCDALVVHHVSLAPEAYAETWAAPGHDHAADVARWTAWYRERGIGAIGAAFLLLRRRADDGPPRMHGLEAVAPATARAGIHVGRILAGTDLAALGDTELLARRLRIADGVRVEQVTRRRAGAWQPEAARVRAIPTAGVETSVAADLLPIVWALDGSGPLRDALGRAGLLRRGGAALALARELLELGFAEVPPEPG